MFLVVLLSPIWSLPAYSSKVCILIKQVLPVPVLIPVSCALPFSSCHCTDTFRLIDFIFSLFSFFFFPSALFGAVVGSISALLKEWALNFYSQIPQPCSGLPWRTIGCYSGLCFGHQSLQLSIAQFLQMLSVWHSTIISFLVYPPRWNSWKHDISCHNYCFSVLQLI